MDSYEGDNEDPLSLHKYLYCQDNSINGIDPSGHDGDFVSTMGSMAINSIMSGMAMSATLRAYDSAKAFCAGQALGAIAEDAAIGMGEDALLNVATMGLSKITAIRKAGQIFTRAVNSVWALDKFTRGIEIERKILGRTPRTPDLSRVPNFPVIDDFSDNVATSIKSIDLTAKSYQNASAMNGVLARYAKALSNFPGALRGGIRVEGSEISERKLLIVIEPGAATQMQADAIIAFKQTAAQKWPNIKVDVIEYTFEMK
jgi:hypothetical protein